ncbi:hypothetical protein BJ508DRAFT_413130 [Ascobolus immersus RN42]|uniref:Sld7 C-terminal domain-containing protein n=1 Tax=Ascobolus immersus RN42 TaxID=1160509 RepID=A0A3N4IDE5_ASCIM|nr:hypothetical protein BJ508DRAFT_413130 [Ascobolus immersus RN42]
MDVWKGSVDGTPPDLLLQNVHLQAAYPSQPTVPFSPSLTLTYLATIDTSLLPLSLTGAGNTLQLRSACSQTRTSLAKLFIARQTSGILLAVNDPNVQPGEGVDVQQRPDQILIYPVFSASSSANSTSGPACGLLTPPVPRESNQKGTVQIFALPLSLKNLLVVPEPTPDDDDKARFLLASPTKPQTTHEPAETNGKKRHSMSILDSFDAQKKRKLTPAPSTKAIPSLRTGPSMLPTLSRKSSFASLNTPTTPVDEDTKARRAMISKAVVAAMTRRGLKMESKPGRKDSDIAHAREVHKMVMNCVELSFHNQNSMALDENAIFRSADYFVKGFSQGPETWVSKSRAQTQRMESEAPKTLIKTEEQEVKLEEVESTTANYPKRSIRELLKSQTS